MDNQNFIKDIIKKNNNSYFTLYSVPLKKYIIDKIKKNNELQKYKNIINYFILVENDYLITDKKEDYTENENNDIENNDLNMIDKLLFINKIVSKENYFYSINEKINEISIKNINEVKKRIQYISIIIEKIYKIILNEDKSINEILNEKLSFISSIQIIIIIKLKIDFIIEQNKSNLQSILNNKDTINEITNLFKIF